MFALPGMFCFFAVVIVPFLYGVYLTLTDWNGVAEVKNFVGFKNFGGVVKDAQFWTSLLLTFKYVIFVVIIVNVLAFGIAYLLTRASLSLLPARYFCIAAPSTAQWSLGTITEALNAWSDPVCLRCLSDADRLGWCGKHEKFYRT